MPSNSIKFQFICLAMAIVIAGLVIISLTLRGQKRANEQVQTTGSILIQKPDTSNWKILINNHGWSIRYPSSWDAQAIEADNAQEEFQPILSGPNDCYNKGQECGVIQLGTGWNSPNSQQVLLSAKEDLLQSVAPDSNHILLEQGSTELGGQPVYFAIWRTKLYGNYPNGVIFKKIETKYQNRFYFIALNEEGKDRAAISAVNSPEAWGLNATFEAIVSSFEFTAK